MSKLSLNKDVASLQAGIKDYQNISAYCYLAVMRFFFEKKRHFLRLPRIQARAYVLDAAIKALTQRQRRKFWE